MYSSKRKCLNIDHKLIDTETKLWHLWAKTEVQMRNAIFKSYFFQDDFLLAISVAARKNRRVTKQTIANFDHLIGFFYYTWSYMLQNE